MPPDSSPEDLLKQVHKRILKRVGPQNGDSDSQNVAAKIRHLLDGKRYMMVLSGISSVTMLNCVSASLPDDDNGSRVVLIQEPDTPGVEVARRAGALLPSMATRGSRARASSGLVSFIGRKSPIFPKFPIYP
jgi:hypothetical protein